MAEKQLGDGLAKHFVTVFLLLAILARHGIAFATLDFSVDNGSIGHRFDVGIDHDLTAATVMVNLHVLDAVVANIYTDCFAFSANFSD
jgi:hypothetical protein